MNLKPARFRRVGADRLQLGAFSARGGFVADEQHGVEVLAPAVEPRAFVVTNDVGQRGDVKAGAVGGAGNRE